MDLQPAEGRFYKLVSKEGKHLFCRDVFMPLASTFSFFTKVTQPATLPYEKQKATAQSPPIHRQLNYRSYLQFWERDLAGRRSASVIRKSDLGVRKSDLAICKSGSAGHRSVSGVRRSDLDVRKSGLGVRKSGLDVRKSGLDVGPRARNGRVAGVERACRRRGTVVPQARHDGRVVYRNGGKPGADGRRPHAIQ